jgi:calcineurin-like phosphoesterase family protein
MTDLMINNINSTVKENDILIHLGDLSFGDKSNITKFLDGINCKNIVLLCGNHDHFPIRHNKIALQCDYLEVRLDCGTLVCMFHYPIACWNEQHRGSVCLHGHTHLKYKGDGRIKDIEMNGNNMFPYELTTVVKELCKIPVFTVHSVH